NAAQALGEAAVNKKTQELVLKLLIEKLCDENPDVRDGAAEVLAHADKNEVDISVAVPASIAIPALVKALGDEVRNVRKIAATILKTFLSSIEDKRSLILILRKFPKTSESREFAIEIHKEWMKKQNERIELQKPEMRKPRNNDKGRLKRMVN
ncbi:HEAT repeat domain-containing protein, partial [Candidatus Micrarchaeota archaeon]|nr:HEAT repeat domain-containing protein [Candidatus Micrarchaeota archaeon]